MFIWRRKQILFHKIFEIDPAIKYEVVLDASYSTAISVFILFVYYMSALLFPLTFQFPYYNLAPLLALFIPFIMLFWPSDRTPLFFVRHKGSFAARRSLFFDLLGPVLFAPFAKPTFARCFIADVMCSMPKVLADLVAAFTIAFHFDTIENKQKNNFLFASIRHVKTILEILPFFSRFSQSIRLVFLDSSSFFFSRRWNPKKKNALNAFKYFSAITLTAASVAKSRNFQFHGHRNVNWPFIWLLLSVYCTGYNLFWDVFMDWGLPRHGLFPFWIYGLAVITDAILRLGWAIYVSPEQNVLQQHVILLLGAAEILRRFMWAVFRIEYEHLKHFHVDTTTDAPPVASTGDDNTVLLSQNTAYPTAHSPRRHSEFSFAKGKSFYSSLTSRDIRIEESASSSGIGLVHLDNGSARAKNTWSSRI